MDPLTALGLLLTLGVLVVMGYFGYQVYKNAKAVITGLKQVFDPKPLVCPTGQTLRGLLCYENCTSDEKSDGTNGCYKNGPANWPGTSTLTHLQHNTKYSTVGTNGLPSACDKSNEYNHAGLCYRIESNEEYSSPGFVKRKNCPAGTKRDDGVSCWLYDSHIFNRDAYAKIKGGAEGRCEGDYGKGNCQSAGLYYYPNCKREAKFWSSEIQVNGKCLELKDKNTTNGTPIELGNCAGYGHDNDSQRKQRLFYDSDAKAIKYGRDRDLSKCVDINLSSSPYARIWDCNDSAAQKFDYDRNEGSFKLSSDTSKCLEVSGNNLKLSTCNNSDSQNFKDNPVQDYTNDGLTCRRNPVTVTKLYSRLGYAPTKCPDGKEKVGGLCYPKCPDGYERTAGNLEKCTTICPSGFTNIGIGGCQKPRRNVAGKGLTVVGVCPPDYPIKTGQLCYKRQEDIK